MKFIIVILVALVAICKSEDAQNSTGTDSTITDGKKEETALQKGMSPIFDLYHNFLDTVMSQNFYDAKSASFNVHTLINITKNNDYSQLQSKWQDLVKTFGGYAGCIIVGLLFMVFMPIVGMIYCCCHCCCNKCGGTKEMMDPPRASCKRWTYTVLLLIFVTFMLAGGIITFLGSELLHKSLRNEDNNGLAGKMEDSLGHLQSFTNNTINEIVNLAKKKIIEEGLPKIYTTVKNAANNTVTRVKENINATNLLNKAGNLGDVATEVFDGLQVVSDQVTKLRVLQKNVTSKLEDIERKFDSAPQNVKDIFNEIKFEPNYTALETQQTRINQLKNAVNITPLVAEAEREFEDVSKEVEKKVENEIKNSEDQVNKMNETINNQIGGISDKTKPFLDNVGKGKDFAKDEDETFKQIADYIWYGCIGLGCAVILVVFFYYMGVLFGLCGERPGPRAACCNRQTGAHLLCTGICCSFLFAWILMLVVILMFTLGGLSYSMACKYLHNGIENVDTFESVLSDGFSWNISASFGVKNLTIAGMFKNCKNNMAIYSALHLQYIFDIDKQLNISDIEQEVRNMKITNLDIPNIKLMSDDLKSQLEQFKNASVSDINFTQYTTELNKKLFGNQSLDTIINQLRDAARKANVTNATLARDLNDAATLLVGLKDKEIMEIDQRKANLSSTITTLSSTIKTSVPESIDNLTTSISASENNFNTNKTKIVQEGLGKAVDDILEIIHDTVNKTKDSIKNDIGKCRGLYDAAQSVVDAVCVVTLDPLNAIWFGLGWSLFFYIPCFIFAALLANLYKRTEKFRKKDHGFDDPSQTQYRGSYDGYHGANRYEDNVPLTSMGKDHRKHGNGAYNPGYEGREFEHEPRYHRDEPSGYPPDNYPRDRGAHRGSAGHHYAQPHADPYDQPPHYDDAVSERYERASGHGGYPRLTHY